MGVDLFYEMRHGLDGEEDVGDGAAARKVGDGEVEALEDGAGDGKTGELLEGFVKDIAGIEVGGDEDVGLAGDMGEVGIIRWSVSGPFGGLFGGDGRVEGGVELHFAVDKESG